MNTTKTIQAHDSNIDLIKGFLIGKFRMWNPADIVSITKSDKGINIYNVVLSHDADVFFDNWDSMDNVFICNRYTSITVKLDNNEFDLHLSYKEGN